jgi:hypothetical protein
LNVGNAGIRILCNDLPHRGPHSFRTLRLWGTRFSGLFSSFAGRGRGFASSFTGHFVSKSFCFSTGTGRSWRGWRRRTGLFCLSSPPSFPSLFRIQHRTARPTTDKEVSKRLQDRASTTTNQALLKDPGINKFPLRVVALLDEVLEDGSGAFLGKFPSPGNTCTSCSLTKAPCNGFGVDLGSEAFSNGAESGDTQGASDSG